MPLFKQRFRLKARGGRGQNGEGDEMAPADALKDILVVNYGETKEDFDKLDG